MSWFTDFIWYTVEFCCYISIIAYTLFTFKILKPFGFKNDVPSTFNQTWKDTNSFLNAASGIASKVNQVLGNEPKNNNSNNNNDEEEKEE